MSLKIQTLRKMSNINLKLHNPSQAEVKSKSEVLKTIFNKKYRPSLAETASLISLYDKFMRIMPQDELVKRVVNPVNEITKAITKKNSVKPERDATTVLFEVKKIRSALKNSFSDAIGKGYLLSIKKLLTDNQNSPAITYINRIAQYKTLSTIDEAGEISGNLNKKNPALEDIFKDNMPILNKPFSEQVKGLIDYLTKPRPSKAKSIIKNAHNKELFEKSMQEVRRQLNVEFVNRIQMENFGDKVEMPNCLMLIGKDENLAKSIIKDTADSSDCDFVELADTDNEKLMDKLWDTMQKSKETFDATKRRTLIGVEGFDRLINPKINDLDSIDGLKDVMARCAEDFGTTIIFRTDDTTKLTKEAIQPQRVAAKIIIPDSI